MASFIAAKTKEDVMRKHMFFSGFWGAVVSKNFNENCLKTIKNVIWALHTFITTPY